VAGLHHAAEGGASAVRAVAEFRSVKNQLLHRGSWRRWRGNLLILPAMLPSCHMKTEIFPSLSQFIIPNNMLCIIQKENIITHH
jgi:hypothetical protein